MSQDERRAKIAAFVKRAYAALDQVDYYRLLNISSAATEEQIRASYYNLAASLHPDVHGFDVDAQYRRQLTTVYSRVVEAYKVLADARIRQRYDVGLAAGRLRMSMGTEVESERPAIEDANALRFFKLGEAAMATGDVKSALMNYRFALSVAPDNETIKAAIEKAEAK